MNEKLPAKVENCPIIDALIEIRFETTLVRSAVFGVIYSSIMDEYQGRVINLPILQLPEQIRDVDPTLKFKPLYRIEGDRFIVQIGPDVLCISSKIPYVGWNAFVRHSSKIIHKIISSNIIKRVVRIGHRYVNFFEGDITDRLTLSFSMTEGYDAENILIRSEVKDGEFVDTLQYSNNATYKATQSSCEQHGSLIDIDVFRENDDNCFIFNVEEEINKAHSCGKKLFFSLLKPVLLNDLNPIYDEK